MIDYPVLAKMICLVNTTVARDVLIAINHAQDCPLEGENLVRITPGQADRLARLGHEIEKVLAL